MSNNSYVSVPVEITLNGQLADLTGSNVPFEYYGPEVLSVRWIYPIAGHKKGGTTVTVYGTGFKTLGQDIVSNVFDRKTGKSHGHAASSVSSAIFRWWRVRYSTRLAMGARGRRLVTTRISTRTTSRSRPRSSAWLRRGAISRRTIFRQKKGVSTAARRKMRGRPTLTHQQVTCRESCVRLTSRARLRARDAQ